MSTFTNERLSPTQARVIVSESRGRLLLHLWAATYEQRQEIIADLRATFPGHHDRCWRRATGVWSFPLQHRARLLSWCECWFDSTAISWDAGLPGCSPAEVAI